MGNSQKDLIELQDLRVSNRQHEAGLEAFKGFCLELAEKGALPAYLDIGQLSTIELVRQRASLLSVLSAGLEHAFTQAEKEKENHRKRIEEMEKMLPDESSGGKEYALLQTRCRKLEKEIEAKRNETASLEDKLQDFRVDLECEEGNRARDTTKLENRIKQLEAKIASRKQSSISHAVEGLTPRVASTSRASDAPPRSQHRSSL